MTFSEICNTLKNAGIESYSYEAKILCEEICGDFNEEKDVAKAQATDLAQCIIGPGNFIICMAGEPHKPNIAVGEDTVLKKAVVKVHI